jgi:hypothetical protein
VQQRPNGEKMKIGSFSVVVGKRIFVSDVTTTGSGGRGVSGVDGKNRRRLSSTLWWDGVISTPDRFFDEEDNMSENVIVDDGRDKDDEDG